MIKAVIVYASAGAGHFKAARAIYDYLKKERTEIDVKIVNSLEKSNILLRFSYNFGYPFLIKHLQGLWGLLFWATCAKPLRGFSRGLVSAASKAASRGFADFLEKEAPDYIISTHFLTSEISACLKNSNRIKSYLVSIITDFGVHPFWISKGTDLYVAASAATKELLIAEGVEAQNIKCFGIPVNPVFLRHYQKETLRKKFGLKADKFTVLVVTGSFGIGPIEKIIDLLHKEAQILAVCAKNHKLHKRLTRKNYSNCAVLGYVDNIQELMAASDVVITKPGGMSISESLVMNLLPVFISPIPGQEKENIKILGSQGIGIYPKTVSAIVDAIIGLKNNPDKLGRIRGELSRVRMPDAVRRISDVIR